MLSQSNCRLSEKTTLITGGASGIGLAVAQVFLSEGAKVFIIDYSAANIESARTLLQSRGYNPTNYIFHLADAADEESVISFVDNCVCDFGGLDIAIFNAGIGGKQKPLSQSSAEEYDDIMRINARGRVKYCAAKMQSLGTPGSIIITASVASLMAPPGLCAYNMSKFAARALTVTASLEYAKDNIRVNAVSPGLQDVQAQVREIPLRRIADPAEVAKVFLFPASDDASFVTGSNYRIDGGVVNH
ncbi:hypothetical protein Asppvi_000022 [Aspergillus pseudoviridinutans]|uniref:Oxidoreductase n=1 Tax=Aspergillus pseudoviridinutans TaxID=1517512 RepID=A0A9P3B2W9_9EURO|nr:uncharacterized protein Asppvi_000022 [Aspergillus pseudoviridinutans]GIJ81523.1 hypothetical protein Asppvi_000022 [Aspergillus pseudoviridinutans]